MNPPASTSPSPPATEIPNSNSAKRPIPRSRAISPEAEKGSAEMVAWSLKLEIRFLSLFVLKDIILTSQ